MSNQETLKKLAASLASFIDDNEQVPLSFFSAKLVRAQENFPNDYTIGMMNTVVARMNDKKMFISRAEIKDLYQKFYSTNNKFASVFSDELGFKSVEEKERIVPADYDDKAFKEGSAKLADQELLDIFRSALGDGSGESFAIKEAVSACQNQLKMLGISAEVNGAAAQNEMVVCVASFETPRGKTSVFLPVEMLNKKAFAPTVFIGNKGTQDLNYSNLVEYLKSQAGNKLDFDAQSVLKVAVCARNDKREISDVDFAINKLASSNEELSNLLTNSLVYAPKHNSAELDSIAKTFDSKSGLAKFTFGDKVDQGKLMVARMLNTAGLKTYNISVVDSDDNSIVYAISANGGTVAFKVPVKVAGDQLLPPSVLVCAGEVRDFSKDSISVLVRENGFDRQAASIASPLYGNKPSELVETIRSAMKEANYSKAEEALTVLSESGDSKAYAKGLGLFTIGLNDKKAENLEESIHKCALIVKSRHSQYDICGHTGLPLHKVYTDKHGDCVPIYRKAMADTYEGATFVHSKVFFNNGS